MRLRKADWLFVLAVALVVLFISLLPTPREKNPPIPNTPDHRSMTSEKGCADCHAPQGSRPLLSRHPKRQDCFRCHRRSETG
ncbi:MAG: hypothetical protein C4293_02575 [Nitrospiraceae bacterium]